MSRMVAAASAALVALLPSMASANSAIVVDAVGHAIGYLDSGSPCQNSPSMAVYSKSGYLACFVFGGPGTFARIDSGIYPPGSSGIVSGADLYFQSIDCTGQPFVSGNNGTFVGGFVVETSRGLQAVGFVASQPIGFSSYLQGPTSSPICTATAGGPFHLAPVMPASSVATYFNPSPYIAPLFVHVLPDSELDDEIFFDGLDAAY